MIAPYIELIADPEVAFWTASTQTFPEEQLLYWLSSRPSARERLDWAVFGATKGEFTGENVVEC